MKAKQIKEGIFWVGANDWNLRDFHGYKTSRGSSYNAYLIMDKKIVLVDTVKSSHTEEMLERIKSIIDPKKIDIVISNHAEMDHSGSLPDIFKIATNAKLITSPNGEKGLSGHFDTSNWKIQTIKSGESINIGTRNINFIHTPMLHWPDSMVCYIPEEKLLLPNDAFGQHLASEKLFDDENSLDIIIEEAAKYYANIVYPFAAQVKKAVDALSNLDIEMIAPSHGVIWRKNLSVIINKYLNWANQYRLNKALIIYDTMWGSTEKIASILQSSFEENNIPVIQRSLKTSHISDIMADMLEAKYVAIGSPILNNQILPSMASLLTYMKGLKPKNKIGFTFGSYGWNHAGINEIESVMSNLKWILPISSTRIKYRPTKKDIIEIKENMNITLKELINDK